MGGNRSVRRSCQLAGDVAPSASSQPTLLFQGDLQEEVETEVADLGEEGRVGEGALEVVNPEMTIAIMGIDETSRGSRMKRGKRFIFKTQIYGRRRSRS